MNRIDVSVIIPVYNASALLPRCLDSVFAQQKRIDIEVILIDDGSTDNSVALIKSRPENGIVLLSQTNAGPASARNKGIEAARGSYLAFLDADDYWLPGFLDRTVAFLDNNPEAIAVSVGQRHRTISGSHVLPQFLEQTTEPEAVLLDDFFAFWSEHNHVCTGSVLMRTDVVRQTHGQRTELRICEDLEFWAFLATWGKWGFIPEILFVSDGGEVTRQIGWLEKNKKRWASAPTLEQWERRIVTRLPDTLSESYRKSCGRIARNLCYSILLSGRKDLARQQCLTHGAFFPAGRLTSLLRIAARNRLCWNLITTLLIQREYNRK